MREKWGKYMDLELELGQNQEKIKEKLKDLGLECYLDHRGERAWRFRERERL